MRSASLVLGLALLMLLTVPQASAQQDMPPCRDLLFVPMVIDTPRAHADDMILLEIVDPYHPENVQFETVWFGEVFWIQEDTKFLAHLLIDGYSTPDTISLRAPPYMSQMEPCGYTYRPRAEVQNVSIILESIPHSDSLTLLFDLPQPPPEVVYGHEAFANPLTDSASYRGESGPFTYLPPVLLFRTDDVFMPWLDGFDREWSDASFRYGAILFDAPLDWWNRGIMLDEFYPIVNGSTLSLSLYRSLYETPSRRIHDVYPRDPMTFIAVNGTWTLIGNVTVHEGDEVTFYERDCEAVLSYDPNHYDDDVNYADDDGIPDTYGDVWEPPFFDFGPPPLDTGPPSIWDLLNLSIIALALLAYYRNYRKRTQRQRRIKGLRKDRAEAKDIIERATVLIQKSHGLIERATTRMEEIEHQLSDLGANDP